MCPIPGITCNALPGMFSCSRIDCDFAFINRSSAPTTMETARTFGLRTRPKVPEGDVLRAKIEFDPHRCRDIYQIIDVWLPLTLAMNRINRSMGQPDLYVLSP